MMLLTGANNGTYRKLMRERPNEFGWLTQPRAYYRNKLSKDNRIRWAMDNDAFNNFNAERFMGALEYLMPQKDRCIFVVSPDVVGNHAETLSLWHEWYPVISSMGFPVAFVGQDGLVIDEVPWNQMDAFFVGGTDQFKDFESAEAIRIAQGHGLWVHIGRVNDSQSRLRYCLSIGADSIDGSAYAFKPTKMLKWYQNQLEIWDRQRRLL